MAQITIMRTDTPLPTEQEMASVRKFLQECIRGVTEPDRKAWNRFWSAWKRKEPGEMAVMDLVFPRNYQFHKKLFALLTVGFDAWEPDRKRYSYKGKPIQKNFERFREQVIILAGYYDQVFDLRTSKMEMVAKSISYAAMDDAQFEELYSAVVDVILREVCTTYAGRDELDAVVERVMGFT